jgi:hypothetical protein
LKDEETKAEIKNKFLASEKASEHLQLNESNKKG